ncbi:unnamed protein product, partial [Owenia fusiformis]
SQVESLLQLQAQMGPSMASGDTDDDTKAEAIGMTATLLSSGQLNNMPPAAQLSAITNAAASMGSSLATMSVTVETEVGPLEADPEEAVSFEVDPNNLKTDSELEAERLAQLEKEKKAE